MINAVAAGFGLLAMWHDNNLFLFCMILLVTYDIFERVAGSSTDV